MTVEALPSRTSGDAKSKDAEHRFRMKDLCEAAGLERQAIHFYIQQGLLPPGRKTGRNMAWYTQAHIDRLLLIKKLQNEQFLPLKAIKALLDGRDSSFTPQQRAFLTEVKGRLGSSLNGGEERGRMIDAASLAERAGVELRDIEEAVEVGAVGSRTTEDGELEIAAADAWMVELFGQMRRLGFTRELGFTVKDVMVYEEAMSRLFQEEVLLVSGRLAGLPPSQAAAMIERALPVIHTFLTRYHASRVRDFFGSL
ncbi:MAG: MerR family transcriptional regulator [Myxococcota bacterium]